MEQDFNIKADAVIDSVRCSGCGDLLTIPVYQCSSGHSLCSVCATTKTVCSECNSPITTELRNHSMERVLEGIETSCRFAGCPQKVRLGHRLTHETECDFNPHLKCIYSECAWVGDQFIDHLKANHSVKEFVMPKTGGVRGWNSKSWKNADWGYSIWRFGEDVILNKSYSDGETFYVYVYDLRQRYRVVLSTVHTEYGIEFEVTTSPIRNKVTSQMPFHVSIAEAEEFLLEPAHELEHGYKRLSLSVRLIDSYNPKHC